MATKKIETKKDTSGVIKEISEEILSMMGIPCSVTVVSNEDGGYVVNIETEESGLLIGYHGETLGSLQMVLGLIVFRKLGEWARIVVEVGDYRARREEQLRAMAESYASQVEATGEPVYLPSLPAIERRIVHVALSERKGIVTESEGEGSSRRLVIKLA
jgi:spoIIIJ-associated protein